MQPRPTVADGLTFVDVPTSSPAPGPQDPVVLSLHGRGDRPHVPVGAAFYGIGAPFRYLAPQAPERLGAGFSWLPGRIAHGDPAAMARAIAARVDQIAAAVDALVGDAPVVATGFSQGAILTLGLALRHPGRLRAALPTAGLLPASFVDEALRGGAALPPILGLHGEADREVPVDPARALYERLRAAGGEATLETFPGAGHAMTPEMHARKGAQLREAVEHARGAIIG